MLGLVLVVTGCANKSEVAADRLRAAIGRDLKPGDSEERIVEFMKRNGCTGGFDKFAKRYLCKLSQSKSTSAIGVESEVFADIYVNADRSFIRADVKVLNTYL